MHELDVCRICNHPDPRDLHRALAHWRDALPGMAYEFTWRCRDVEACRRRCELAKVPWPLVETSRQREAS